MKNLNLITFVMAYGALGGFLSSAGIHVYNWRYWAILACVIIIQINEHLASKF